MRVWLVLPLLVVGARAAQADPPPAPSGPAASAAKPAPPPTPGQAADAVLAAVKRTDDAALKALAAKDDPDPWLVADELIGRGELESADAFAKAAPRVDVEKLPAYVAAHRGKPDDGARRARFAAATAALGAGRFADGLAALGAEETPIDDVVGVRLAIARSAALGSLARHDESAAASATAGEAAERIGWLARAARAYFESGMIAYRGSAFSATRDAWRHALSLCERRGDKIRAARALGNLGLVCQALGDHVQALATYERALAAAEALGDRAGVANTLDNIGSAHRSLGEYAKALAALERALATAEAMGNAPVAAVTLGNIGAVHESLGDYAKALSAFERAFAALEALGDRVGAAHALGSMGNAYFLLGDSAKALSTHERALAELDALGSKVEAALLRCNIGVVHESLGDHAKALALMERALVELEALGNQAGAARTLCSMAAVRDSVGELAKAIELLERAKRVAESLGADELRVAVLRGLSRTQLRQGDAGRAVESAHQAVSLLKTLVGGLGEEQGSTARGAYTSLFSTGLSAAARAGDVAEAAYFLERGRAGTLLESLGARSALHATLLPDDLRDADAEARAGEARALAASATALDGGDLAASRARAEELKAARARVLDVAERIQREAKRAARIVYPETLPVDDIQRTLVAGDALVLYGLAEKDAAAHALVLTKSEARIVDLGTSSDIVADAEAFDATDPDTDPAPALDRLRERLAKPLALAASTRRVLVSPEGPLSYVPFAALLPDLDVAYEPSGTTYGVLLEEKEKHGENVLALGDPDYTGSSGGAQRIFHDGRPLSPLPATRVEVERIGTTTLLGRAASEDGLRSALTASRRWRAVHFACHGLVNPDRPTLSSLALTPGARADGFLTALEVLRMEIPSDLVVLSACETGKGKIVGGEGIVGLTRAFMYAGAPRVICSLWKVDDEATRALMVKFYELWSPKDGKPGLPTAEALRKAQEFVKSQEKWKHPYYWAAWVLWGLPS